MQMRDKQEVSFPEASTLTWDIKGGRAASMREAAGVVALQCCRNTDLAASPEELLGRQIEAGAGVDTVAVPVPPHSGHLGVTLRLAGQEQLLVVSGFLQVLAHRFICSWKRDEQKEVNGADEDTESHNFALKLGHMPVCVFFCFVVLIE